MLGPVLVLVRVGWLGSLVQPCKLARVTIMILYGKCGHNSEIIEELARENMR